jgi:hypothetical protein
LASLGSRCNVSCAQNLAGSGTWQARPDYLRYLPESLRAANGEFVPVADIRPFSSARA